MLKPLPFMHPRLIDAPAKGDGWLHENKYDGYLTQLVVEDGAARAFTRNGHDWTAKYGPIVAAANTLPCTSAIIDGELIVQDENGISDFAALRSAITKAPHRLLFFAFDLLHLNGHDLRDMILEDRRELLADLIEDRDPIFLSSEFDGEGAAFFAVAEGKGLEGMVSKKKGSRYNGGETDLWVKTKAWLVEEFDVAGVKRGDDGLPMRFSAARASMSELRSCRYGRRSATSSGASWSIGPFLTCRHGDGARSMLPGSSRACGRPSAITRAARSCATPASRR